MQYVAPLQPSDTWLLQENAVYTFRQAQLSRRFPNGRRQWQQQQEPPDIILLCLWPQATAHQVEQYVEGYRELYPSARPVLSHGNANSTFRCDTQAYEKTLNDLIDVQSAAAISSSSTTVPSRAASQRPSVLLHLFGTSGATGACQLLRGFRLRTGGPLNVGAVIADTEPSASLTTILTSCHQPLSSAIIALVLAFWMQLQQYMFSITSSLAPPQHDDVHEDLNNPTLLPHDARKCFVFAHRGLMLTWMKNKSMQQQQQFVPRTMCSSVWTNDEQDERREYAFRRSCIDQKGRWSGDQERYWSGIEGVWEGR